jgi:RHS repeat-associated protein
VQGAAQVGTDVRVNGTVATRQGEYFRFEGTAGLTTAQWLDQAVTLNGASLISGRKKYVPPQTETMLHDVAGNRIQDGRWEMRWDNENRLIDVQTLPAAATAGLPNQRLRYTYDADGRLIERRRFSWVSGAWSLEETTRYLNDGLQCVAEFNATNGLLRRQVWGLDLDGSRGGLGGIGGLLWIVSQANGTHYAAPDGSGNVVALFGTSGTETARYEYGPFGELLRMSGTAIAAENPWRFSSKRQDPTTDWVHYEFRVYDPSSGRWLSRDPIGEAGGENLYGFVGNDPVNGVDPFGLRTPRTWSEYQAKLLTLLNLMQLKQQRLPSLNCAPAACGAEQLRVGTHGDELDERIELVNRELGLAQAMFRNWTQPGPAQLIAAPGSPVGDEGGLELPEDLGSLDGPPLTTVEAEALNSPYWQGHCYVGCNAKGMEEASEMIPGSTAFVVARSGLGLVRCAGGVLKASTKGTKVLAQDSATAASGLLPGQMLRNKAQGALGEAAVRARLLNSKNLELLGEQIRIATPGVGTCRITDFMVRSRKSGKLGIIEVKTGEATRDATQLAKDALIADPLAPTLFVGRRAVAAGFPSGTPTGPIRTFEINASRLKP